jgi:hypothetical protein
MPRQKRDFTSNYAKLRPAWSSLLGRRGRHRFRAFGKAREDILERAPEIDLDRLAGDVVENENR